MRLIVFGTGATPLLGADLAPSAGIAGGPPGTTHNGHDFVYMRDFVVSPPEPGDSELATAEAEHKSLAMETLRRLKPKRKTSPK